MGFVPLYLQTEYSMLQSSCGLVKTFEYVKKMGYTSLAMTDEGNMYGAIKFYQLALKNNIKPIIGLKLNYEYNGIESSILLYAMNNFGYRNLMKLSSTYMIQDKKIDLSVILNNGLGLLAIVPFSESVLFRFYKNRNFNAIFQHISILKSTFDQFYVGLSQQTKEDKIIINDCYNMFKQNNINVTALHKISYLEDSDVDVYRTLRSISRGAELVELSEKEYNQMFYSSDEMGIMFNDLPMLVDTTEEIAMKCNVTIDFGNYHLPKYSDEIDADIYLRELSLMGLKKRITINNVTNVAPYIERLNYELETIKNMGFSDYFLIVWDFIKYAKTNNIYVGPGRGSAPASLVGYSLGITDIDPLRYNLLFERFLNSERITMPDIDTDFPDDVRDEVIKYVGRKYGTNRVAHISTFGTFKAKLALRDTSRVYKLSDTRLNEVLKCINNLSTKELYSSTLEEIIEKTPALQTLMDNYDDIYQVVTIASKIEGLPRNTSTHAAGIIITGSDLIHYTPLDKGLDDIYQTQFEATDLEALGLLKMDFLGLRNLTNISKCIDLIKLDNPNFTFPKEMNDKDTFNMIARGDVSGVFQLESAGMRKVLMDMRVNSFEDICSALALYRPGPMDMIPHFIARKHKKEEVIYPHPDLEPILKETYGTIVYQDQIMLIARKFAGYSLGRADILRRAVSKKKLDVLEAERTNFVKSSVELGYDNETANNIYDYIVKFASYGFNKAHSVAYAKVSYQTAYLKCHYLPYYLATLMTSVIESDTDIKLYYQEALKNGLQIVAPMINKSTDEFVTINNAIVFPLSMIKGIGTVKVKELLAERAKGKFIDFDDFVKRTSSILGGSLIENVIYSGALDEFGLTKKAMIDNYQKIVDRMSYDFVSEIIAPEYDTEEFTYGELIDLEKNILGLNLKYNFLNKYQYLYEQNKLTRIKDLRENTFVKTLGVIQHVKSIKTKNDETMAFVKLTDDIASVELTLFPSTYQKYNHLRSGLVVIVSGRIERRKDLQLIVNEIENI